MSAVENRITVNCFRMNNFTEIIFQGNLRYGHNSGVPLYSFCRGQCYLIQTEGMF